MTPARKNATRLLPVVVIIALFTVQFVLPDYHHTNVARILVLTTFATSLTKSPLFIVSSPFSMVKEKLVTKLITFFR